MFVLKIHIQKINSKAQSDQSLKEIEQKISILINKNELNNFIRVFDENLKKLFWRGNKC